MLVCYVLKLVCVFPRMLMFYVRMIYMIFWLINKTCIDFGMVVETAKTHLLQQKFVHILRVFIAPISVDVSDSSERWVTNDMYVKVNSDAISFRGDVGWIALVYI